MPMSRRQEGRAVTSRPATTTRPPLAGISPPTMRSVVVLPQPEGPSRASSSPCSTSNESDATAAGPAP